MNKQRSTDLTSVNFSQQASYVRRDSNGMLILSRR